METTAKTFALALSGKDGSPIWSDAEVIGSVANHANAFPSRGIAVVPLSAGVLVVAADPGHTGLRAVQFRNASVPR